MGIAEDLKKIRKYLSSKKEILFFIGDPKDYLDKEENMCTVVCVLDLEQKQDE